jgi:S-methylmethionine-dependent homocysteine/selenocysteine methylase
MSALPQLADDRLFVCDGGLETTLVFERGLELPCFAAFPLVTDDAGRALLRDYFAPYAAIARRHGAGMIVDTATWRANPDWGERLGFHPDALAEANRASVELASEIAAAGDVINGVVGPRGDGYDARDAMSPAAARRYHAAQIETLAGAGADMITAVTLTYADEATGVVRAAGDAGVPAAISFTVETDGRLPSGEGLRSAIEQVDAETDGAAAYYMINCAHPTHFAAVVGGGGEWRERIRGIRANASRKSHAELDESGELDAGDPEELAARYRELRQAMPSLNVVGGCCGTSHEHVAAICAAWRSVR